MPLEQVAADHATMERAGHLPVGSTVRFGKVFAFRDRIVHLYDRVDDGTVFDIVQHHLDDLEDLARRYTELVATDSR